MAEEKKKTEPVLFGVCAHIADEYGWDVWFVRIMFMLLACNDLGLIYLIYFFFFL